MRDLHSVHRPDAVNVQLRGRRELRLVAMMSAPLDKVLLPKVAFDKPHQASGPARQLQRLRQKYLSPRLINCNPGPTCVQVIGFVLRHVMERKEIQDFPRRRHQVALPLIWAPFGFRRHHRLHFRLLPPVK